MQVTGKKNLSTWKSLTSQYPKGHAFIALGLIVGLGLIAALPSEDASAKRHSKTRILKLPPLSEPGAKPVTKTPPEKLAKIHSDIYQSKPLSIETTLEKHTEVVRSGDSLSLIFARVGLSDRDMLELINSCDAGQQLAHIYPGQKLAFHIDSKGQLQKLEYIKNRLYRKIFTRTEDGFTDSDKVREPDVLIALRHATIENSLFLAGKKAHLHSDMIMGLANIFGWDINFALDIREGDTFKVLFEEKFLDGQKIGNGEILAAQFTNQGETFRAVRYVGPNGESQYYTPTGKSMRKAFLQAPLDFRRISSNFNPNRLHPIYKTVRPHRGTDYAASIGTPIWASGDGLVYEAGYSRPNGNYVFIQHGNNVRTKYLHMHEIYVEEGERVTQKEVIGTVGSTGYATGPHLHYEFLLDGVHRNPRTILQKLPKAESIPEDQLQRFYAQTQPLLAQLDGRKTRFAKATQAEANPTL